MTNQAFPQHNYPEDVHCLYHEDKTILLIGTAHVSQESVELVKRVIAQEDVDTVCIELDEKRYSSLNEKKRWQNVDLRTIIKKKQLSILLINLIMASYQKKLGEQTGVTPGAELLAAANAANAKDIPISLCDRDIRITLRRAWKSTPFWRKAYLITSLFSSLFDQEEISEEKLQDLRKKDVLSELMKEMGASLPELKQVLIDERDIFLAEKIKESKGEKIVAVVGAGHVPGIQEVFTSDNSALLNQIISIPPVSPAYKILGWSIPAIIIASVLLLGFRDGAETAGHNAMFWILANGIPASIGAMIAAAHPLTIIGSFLAAPITSLTPVIGAGYVSAFLQVLLVPPIVREFENAGEDINRLKGWWQNRLLRVLLVFILTGFGSIIGTWVGGYEIISNLAG